MKNAVNRKNLASIQYVGTPGITRHCLDGISRYIHFGDIINSAVLLSHFGEHSGEHGFLLDINYGDVIAVKSGFSSGYSGEGPGGLSKALQLLSRHGVEIDEYEVSEDFIRRLDESCLLSEDLDFIEKSRPVRPCRWYDYIHEHDCDSIHDNQKLADVLPITVPFAFIDHRIIDLALNLDQNPDGSLNSGYKRLEDQIRKRSGLVSESGSRLFSKAFQGDKSIFYWGDNDGGEHNGKASLFTAVYSAYRNRRAHREFESKPCEVVREFLLINELFILESKATKRPEEFIEE